MPMSLNPFIIVQEDQFVRRLGEAPHVDIDGVFRTDPDGASPLQN
jgi:hypothetical protein